MHAVPRLDQARQPGQRRGDHHLAQRHLAFVEEAQPAGLRNIEHENLRRRRIAISGVHMEMMAVDDKVLRTLQHHHQHELRPDFLLAGVVRAVGDILDRADEQFLRCVLHRTTYRRPGRAAACA